MSYLVDTNVISELCRPQPHPAVLRWAERIERHTLSVISVEEIWHGLAKRPNHRLTAWMEEYVRQHDLLPIDAAIAQRAGELRGAFARKGSIHTQADMLIAATAQLHGLTLVTRNTCDFEGCGIGLLNPFADGIAEG